MNSGNTDPDGDSPTLPSTAVLDVIEAADHSYLETEEIVASLEYEASVVVEKLRELERTGQVCSRSAVGCVLWWDPADTPRPGDGIAVDQTVF